MLKPTLDRISRDEMLMRIASVVSARGTCLRASVGAVISVDGRIISTGYVGSPSGFPHCSEVGCEIGTHGGCTRTIHAEANAISWAARYGVRTEGGELYCTHSCCSPCGKLIINAGIRKFVYEKEYRDDEGLRLLILAGLEVVQLGP